MFSTPVRSEMRAAEMMGEGEGEGMVAREGLEGMVVFWRVFLFRL